jgi:hypothetical protein
LIENFKRGDRVKTVNVKDNGLYSYLLGHIGTVIDIDIDFSRNQLVRVKFEKESVLDSICKDGVKHHKFPMFSYRFCLVDSIIKCRKK